MQISQVHRQGSSAVTILTKRILLRYDERNGQKCETKSYGVHAVASRRVYRARNVQV